jgi:maltose-binding protein MalE
MAEKHLAAFFPSNVEAANSKFVQSLPHMDVFVKSMEWAYPSTVVPLAHGVFWRAYQDAWDQAIRGQRSAQVALEQAQQTVQKALDEQWEYSSFYKDYLHRKNQSLRTMVRAGL